MDTGISAFRLLYSAKYVYDGVRHTLFGWAAPDSLLTTLKDADWKGYRPLARCLGYSLGCPKSRQTKLINALGVVPVAGVLPGAAVAAKWQVVEK